tara:strand:- start:665 stop:940 length:276 start_codon:yes stop_codon:yes gene_type:complete
MKKYFILIAILLTTSCKDKERISRVTMDGTVVDMEISIAQDQSLEEQADLNLSIDYEAQLMDISLVDLGDSEVLVDSEAPIALPSDLDSDM